MEQTIQKHFDSRWRHKLYSKILSLEALIKLKIYRPWLMSIHNIFYGVVKKTILLLCSFSFVLSKYFSLLTLPLLLD